MTKENVPYSLQGRKKNRSFYNFEDEINLQELNGTDMGRILHSTNACINIVNHIGKEMRKVLEKEILDSKSRMSIIIDESNSEPLNLFIDLIKLECVTAKGIFSSLMSHLKSLGFTEEFLSEHFISLTCDGAAVMFGSRSGVATLFKEKCHPIVVWHCASHRLELSINDAIKEVDDLNLSWTNYTPYTTHLQKNARELKKLTFCPQDGLLPATNTVAAVQQNNEAIVLHFEEAKEDRTRDKKDCVMYEGLLRKISSVMCILDLELMCDSLQELSKASLYLQERNIDLYKAHFKFKDLVEVFEKRKTCPGSAYRKSLEAAENLKFCGGVLHKKGRIDEPPISPSAFYESLKNLIQKQLLCNSDVEMARCATVLDFRTWPTDAKENILFGEEEICELSKRFQLNERELISTFREFVKSPDEMPEKQHLKNTLHITPVSSSECEQGFTQMNVIVTPDRAALLIETIKNIIFEPSKYVKKWLLRRCHSAIDTNSKSKTKDEEENGGIAQIWK
ncbi:hypothetical protein PR048_004935, partial [Dryococelus australis]